jgi:hypothetical protein
MVVYDLPNPTNQSVTASLTGCSEPVTPFPQQQLLATNSTGSFHFADVAGNTGVTPYAVNRIDKTPPQILILEYLPTTPTSGAVDVTITFDEPTLLPVRTKIDDYTYTKTYTVNTTESISFSDILGNTNTQTITISNILQNLPNETRPSEGGGGVLLLKDVCPDGDFSPSYYDKQCEVSHSDPAGLRGKNPEDEY